MLRAPQDLMRSLPSSSQGLLGSALEGRERWECGTERRWEGRGEGEGPRDRPPPPPPVWDSDLALKLTTLSCLVAAAWADWSPLGRLAWVARLSREGLRTRLHLHTELSREEREETFYHYETLTLTRLKDCVR